MAFRTSMANGAGRREGPGMPPLLPTRPRSADGWPRRRGTGWDRWGRPRRSGASSGRSDSARGRLPAGAERARAIGRAGWDRPRPHASRERRGTRGGGRAPHRRAADPSPSPTCPSLPRPPRPTPPVHPVPDAAAIRQRFEVRVAGSGACLVPSRRRARSPLRSEKPWAEAIKMFHAAPGQLAPAPHRHGCQSGRAGRRRGLLHAPPRAERRREPLEQEGFGT